MNDQIVLVPDVCFRLVLSGDDTEVCLAFMYEAVRGEHLEALLIELIQLILRLSEDFRIYYFPFKVHRLPPGKERQ
jgi:hypothetical protein